MHSLKHSIDFIGSIAVAHNDKKKCVMCACNCAIYVPFDGSLISATFSLLNYSQICLYVENSGRWQAPSAHTDLQKNHFLGIRPITGIVSRAIIGDAAVICGTSSFIS